MLREIMVDNFMSFKYEATFSFVIKKESQLKERYVIKAPDGSKLLKLGILYGANASGKSNFIKVFDFLKAFLFKPSSDIDQPIKYTPFLLDHESINSPTKFRVDFYAGDRRFIYNLELQGKVVLSEKLDCYYSSKPSNIFQRTFRDGISIVKFGSIIDLSKKSLEELQLRCLNNMSLLGAYKQVNIIVPELEVVKTWYNQNFTQTIIAKDNLLNYAKSILSNHAEFKEKVLSFLQKADSNIVNYKMDKYQLPIPTTVIENIFNTEISSKMKSKLEANPVIIREELLFEHEVEIGSKRDKFYLSDHEQSDGTMRLFGLAGIITQAIEKGSLIVIDELDSSLHPLLVEEILRNFLIESNESQLIITTHAENVLDQSGLVKECFWFVEKIEDGSSDIYPLSGFKGLSRIGSIRKSYRLGLFGATPEFSS